MRINERPLNPQALTLEEAEGKIRLAVKDACFKRIPFDTLKKTVRKIINEALEQIRIPSLADAAERSLTAFFSRTVRTVASLPRRDVITFLALAKLAEGEEDEYTRTISRTEARRIVREIPSIPPASAHNYGTALNMYHKEYIEDKIAPVMDRLAKEQALDPDAVEYLGERQSLRARAEREVRYERHAESYREMKERGVKLVIISSHANCSERCMPYQGRVFSLDGSSGTTEDGRAYEPLEKATDVFYVTRAGAVWKNGLFGFNCRHKMVEFKPGLRFPKTSVTEERKQYKIDMRQRELERRIVRYKVRAEMARGTDAEEYKHCRDKARYWDKYYISFSKQMGRAYYQSRTKTL